jgi:glycosyltransferase involved in cell wall biosynthesis
MRILYLPCHESLEQNEVSLLTELGHYVFSPGSFVSPENRADNHLRPNIPGLQYTEEDKAAWSKVSDPIPPGQDAKNYLTREFVDRFDLVIIMHLPRWVSRNWEAMKHKPVLWRTIGQCVEGTEIQMRPFREKGMKILRYSPMEENIPSFCGLDGMIRFFIDPNEFKDWNGDTNEIVTFGQSMQKRGPHCNFKFFEETTKPFPRKLFGPETEEVSFGKGKVPFDQLKAAMRDHRVYFYTGTHPASYTLNFMESLCTGIPLVCIGPEHGNFFPGHNLYEIPRLIESGVNGFYSDDQEELRSWIRQLMDNHSLAKDISQRGRETAIRHFGKPMIKEAWRHFLGSVK